MAQGGFQQTPTGADSLSALGGDLTLSIAWAVANELLSAAKSAEIGEAELIGMVLATSIVLSSLPQLLSLLRAELVLGWKVLRGSNGPKGFDLVDGQPREAPAPTSVASVPVSNILSFLTLFVRVAQRISMSVCVQLIADNVKVHQPLRAVRVITLMGVAVFFVFVESTGSVGRVARD